MFPNQVDMNMYFELKKDLSIAKGTAIMQVQNREYWISPIRKYLKVGEEPKDREVKRRLRNQVARYTLLEGKLYKRSFTMSYLKHLNEEGTTYMLTEIYEGVCNNYLGASVVMYKLLKRGYCWPTIKKNATMFI